MTMDLKSRVLAGQGILKADTILERCRILNVNTKEILDGNIAIRSGTIVGIGNVSGLKGEDTNVIDIGGRFISPGLMDGHVHVESSMVTLGQFSRAAMAHGTTSVVIDPHEIANVLGKDGIEILLNEARTLPLNVFVAIPSCVPATSFETNGASITTHDIESLINNERVVALGEMMDYSGVLAADEMRLSMIGTALDNKLVVDGHCPKLQGKELWGYMCAGITTEHEAIEYDEALEKLRLGMTLMIREGSAARSLEKFLPRLIRDGVSLENVFFMTDDKHPGHLLHGYMDVIVRRAISMGLDPLDAISLCTINTARHYHVDHLIGSISIGRKADLVVLDDLEDFAIHSVYANGQLHIDHLPEYKYPDHVFNTIEYGTITAEDLRLIATPGKEVGLNVIGVLPDEIMTQKIEVNMAPNSEGILIPDVDRDLLSVAVVERHGKNGNIGRGFINGFGLEQGAFGQSIGHDSHNVIVTGTAHSDMALCVNHIKKMQGGICIVQDGKVIDSLPLPFAGLLSTWSVEEVDAKLTQMHQAMRQLGCTLPAPFITHSFITLPVIPHIRLTDMGVFDVDSFRLTESIRGKM
ncbi:MAG: adenine deaminase [Euryarchaeota archaeon]|nr:adenine deaminase [Euryarchaeota archaeon]